ncbi:MULTISPECIES: 2Fe-2S iron-sulfur cluster-binding protein [unclassified Moraxella]|uniref:2Fe-2S iron-sulfur cluster-binding protein n=1 Tax=unclassified Moraxella TaxID=2685852 RepID=UPI003AF7A2EE
MAWIFTNSRQFYLHDGETLLAGLLRVGIVADHQCGEGYCGTCKLTHQPLNSNSQIMYDNTPIFMLNEGEILPCSARIVGILQLDLA